MEHVDLKASPAVSLRIRDDSAEPALGSCTPRDRNYQLGGILAAIRANSG
jgi:hypothetical protein